MTTGTIFNQSPPPLTSEDTLRHYIAMLQRELSTTTPDCGVEAFDAADLAAAAFALQERAVALETQAAATANNYNVNGRAQKIEQAQAIAKRNRELAARFAALAGTQKASVLIAEVA